LGASNVYLVDDDHLPSSTQAPTRPPLLTARTCHRRTRTHATDIDLVILTHLHDDHLGFLSLVAARSGAQVATIDVAWLISRSSRWRPRPTTTSRATSRCVTASPRMSRRRCGQCRGVSGLRGPVVVTVLCGTARRSRYDTAPCMSHHRPGQSTTDTILHDRERLMPIAADHLLDPISSSESRHCASACGRSCERSGDEGSRHARD
jgi:hypothetical protein